MHFRSRDLRGSFLLVESKNGELLIGVIHNASTLFTILSLKMSIDQNEGNLRKHKMDLNVSYKNVL